MREILIFAIGAGLFAAGCKSSSNLESMDTDHIRSESKVTVVRPDVFVIWGTRSVRDYIRIEYQEFSRNQAGYPALKLGIRNISGAHWYDTKSESFTLYLQCLFYDKPNTGTGGSAPVFKTNKQKLHLKRGEVSEIQFTCPDKSAADYKVVISEN